MQVRGIIGLVAFTAALGVARAEPLLIDGPATQPTAPMTSAEDSPSSVTPLAVSSPISKPVTPPPLSEAEARWTMNVQAVAGVLNGTLETFELRKAVAGHAWMAPFERNRSESALLISGRLPTRNVVSVRAYLHPSVTSASDLVADLSANGTIAESIRKQLVPPPGRDLRHADATMARWFASALDAQEGDPVALLALYEDGQLTRTPPQLHLILIRGEVGLDGEPKVTRVLYGSLDSAAR